MAIDEKPKENLLRDGKQFPRRLAFHLPKIQAQVLVGIRGNGAWSIFFGEDPVLQFNEAGRLRRLFMDGKKLSADGGRLEELERLSRGGKVQFERQKLGEESELELLRRCRELLGEAEKALAAGASLIGCVPVADEALLPDTLHLLQVGRNELRIANSPSANGS